MSIDYLYGREKDHISLEQQILDELQASDDVTDYYNKLKDVIWATQIAG